MLITAEKIASYRKLADDLDAALAREDDIGMEMLTSMLPELGESIEQINDALRGVDALLFEGLRDEAIGLHHPALPDVALRLHLPDKEQWPWVGAYLESKGIKPPRALDFKTLTTFNAAFAEVDALRKPLDKLRRLALQRAPLTTKISLLRKLKDHDVLKPVWSDQLAAHEELRVLELGDAVKQSLDARDPERVAKLHIELTESGWTIPVSQRLRNDTSGGEAWWGLRRKVAELEWVSKDMLELFARGDGADPESPRRVRALRDLRSQWIAGEACCREWLFAIPQFPAINRFVQEENFGPRLDAMREELNPAMDWLGRLDRRDALAQQFESGCNEIEFMVEHLPTGRGEEGAWLGKAEKEVIGLQQVCQQLPTLRIPELLLTRLERSTAEVRRRGRSRSRNVVISAICGTLLVGAVMAVTWRVLTRKAEEVRIVQMVKEKIKLAKVGEYVVRPEELESAVNGFEENTDIKNVLNEFDLYAREEATRRKEFDDLLGTHVALLKESTRLLEEWRADTKKALGEWPEQLLDAQKKYTSLRAKGGFPGNRTVEAGKTKGGRPSSDDDLPPHAAQQFDNEETRLAEQFDAQRGLTARFENAAIQEFERQLREILDSFGEPGKVYSPEEVAAGLGKLERLLDVSKKPRWEPSKSGQRVPYEVRKRSDPIRARLETLMQ